MSGTQMPLVSIIITSYNRANLIGKAIQSALAQDYPNLEIIVSDNCSTDKSDEIIKAFTSDPRLVYSRNDHNIGMIPNFKKAIFEISKGQLISFISSDDYLIDDKLISDSVELFRKNENLIMLFSRSNFVDASGTVFSTSPERPYFIQELWDGKDVFFSSPEYGLLSWGGTVMQRKSLVEAHVLEAGYISSDTECNYKIMIGGKVAFLNRPTYNALSHSGNASSQSKAADKILHLNCINDIADYALLQMPGEKLRIDQWREYFITTSSYNELKFLKERNTAEYRLFKDYFSTNYPQQYRSFRRRWKYRVFMLLQDIKHVFKKS